MACSPQQQAAFSVRVMWGTHSQVYVVGTVWEVADGGGGGASAGSCTSELIGAQVHGSFHSPDQKNDSYRLQHMDQVELP